ncbi:universal stress protein [Nitrosopumilus sp. K4]|uniref:universal stress protein n=1 Tax=Nitrosopumilus sp. K4 TaxID=2795383 RepID=UPI001BA8FE59|nr:universal stress protein [Nitrosopumilus sp. K4]QUC65483.1 universal stress protein [Nitrosopumilus sp. K4]
MDEITKILVPFDGTIHSQKALESAIYFARKLNSQISLLHVRFSTTISESQNSEMIDLMEASKIKAAQNGIDLNYEIINGKVEKSILDYAKKWKYRLIIMGSYGAGTTDAFYSSVSNSILQNSPIPVLIVK